MPKTALDALTALAEGSLQQFIGGRQRAVLEELIVGEEGQHFIDTICNLEKYINECMHETYGQDGLGLDAVAHLHYFHGGMDFWITEKDMGDGSDDKQLHQAFGWASLTGDPRDRELGYISIQELLDNNVELDLYWEPKKLGDIK